MITDFLSRLGPRFGGSKIFYATHSQNSLLLLIGRILAPFFLRFLKSLTNLLDKSYLEAFANEKLSDSRYEMLSKDYEVEQDNLKATAEAMRKELTHQEQKKGSIKSFITATNKYTDLSPGVHRSSPTLLSMGICICSLLRTSLNIG